MYSKMILLLTGCFMSFMTIAQDVDLDKIAQEEQQKNNEKQTQYTEGTFHTTRLINGHSIENLSAGILDMKISHRFGQLNGGFYQLFGLDNASMRWGLDYGVTPRLMVGLGRSTYQKQYDAFFKYKILRQSEGEHAMPLSVSVMSSIMLNSLKWEDPNRKNYFTSRLYYAFQILAARKFSEGTSLQIMPTMIHYNLVRNATDKNDLFALGIGGRQRITKRVSINAEYYYQIPGYKMAGTSNSFSLGFDIETGGHVFQLHFTNSPGMTERTFVSETFGTWPHGDILFGFNISRLFSIKKNKL